MSEHPEAPRLLITYKGEEDEVAGDPDEPILHSVLMHGIPVPFSCQSGTCLACSAKLYEGEVKMKDSPALSQRTKGKGVILTCSSFPRSEFLRISYDD